MSTPDKPRIAKVLAKNGQFRVEIKELKQTLAFVTDYIEKLEKSSTILENSLVAHGAHLAEKDAQYQAQLAEKDAQYKAHLAEKDAKQAEKDAQQEEKDGIIKEEMEKAEVAYERIFAENVLSKRLIFDLEAQSDCLHAENDSLQTENDSLHTENDALRTENDALHHSLYSPSLSRYAENAADCNSYIKYCIIIFVALISLCLILALALYFMELISETEQAHTEQTEEYPVFINHCFTVLAALFPLQCSYELSNYIANEMSNLNISMSEI